MKELTKEEFLGTMGDKMIDVTENADAVVDIWPFVSELVKKNIVLDYVLENNLVEKVYRNSTNGFDQVLLPTETANVFVVVIVSRNEQAVYGYYKLDLDEEFGL